MASRLRYVDQIPPAESAAGFPTRVLAAIVATVGLVLIDATPQLSAEPLRSPPAGAALKADGAPDQQTHTPAAEAKAKKC